MHAFIASALLLGGLAVAAPAPAPAITTTAPQGCHTATFDTLTPGQRVPNGYESAFWKNAVAAKAPVSTGSLGTGPVFVDATTLAAAADTQEFQFGKRSKFANEGLQLQSFDFGCAGFELGTALKAVNCSVAVNFQQLVSDVNIVDTVGPFEFVGSARGSKGATAMTRVTLPQGTAVNYAGNNITVALYSANAGALPTVYFDNIVYATHSNATGGYSRCT